MYVSNYTYKSFRFTSIEINISSNNKLDEIHPTSSLKNVILSFTSQLFIGYDIFIEFKAMKLHFSAYCGAKYLIKSYAKA